MDLDYILQSQVGHMLITFILMSQSGQKFPECELEQENFSNYIKKLIQLQEKIFPIGNKVNPILDFVGTTANICYIQRTTNRAFICNLGDSKTMHF